MIAASRRRASGGMLGTWSLDPGAAACCSAPRRSFTCSASRRVRGAGRARARASFLAGLAVIATALLSGVDVYADSLLSVHMAQHMLLLMVAPGAARLGRAGAPRARRRAASRAAADRGASCTPRRAHSRSVRRSARRPCAPLIARHLLHGPVRADAAKTRPSTRSSTRPSCWPVWRCFVPLVAADPLPRPPSALARLCSLMLGHDRDGHRRRGALLPGLASATPTTSRTARALHVSALADQQLAGVVMWFGGGLLGAVLTVAVVRQGAVGGGAPPAPPRPLRDAAATGPRRAADGDPVSGAAATSPHLGGPLGRRRNRALAAVAFVCGVLALTLFAARAQSAPTASRRARRAGERRRPGARRRRATRCSCSPAPPATDSTPRESADARPSLRGVGALAADFYLETGRMPLASPRQQPARTRPAFPRGRSAPWSPTSRRSAARRSRPSRPRRGSLSEGQQLFALDCAGCHTIQARGGVVTGALRPCADTRHAARDRRGDPDRPVRDAAVRTAGSSPSAQIDSIARYVAEHRPSRAIPAAGTSAGSARSPRAWRPGCSPSSRS